MSYAAIAARRMPYDIDGTEVGIRTSGGPDYDVPGGIAQGIGSWLDSTSKSNLNKTDRSQTWGGGYCKPIVLWFFFPESREIMNIGFQTTGDYPISQGFTIQGSSDSTNGLDGTWETATFTFPGGSIAADTWRNKIFAISFSGPVKVLRVATNNPGNAWAAICGLHIYGQKAAGQTPDDVIFCTSDGTEITSLNDWGDCPEGTTAYGVFYLKNNSTKTANGLNIQLNHTDFMISTDQANWKAVIDIASLSPGAISQPIYIRRLLQPPLLTLGPKAARAILTIASFT